MGDRRQGSEPEGGSTPPLPTSSQRSLLKLIDLLFERQNNRKVKERERGRRRDEEWEREKKEENLPARLEEYGPRPYVPS